MTLADGFLIFLLNFRVFHGMIVDRFVAGCFVGILRFLKQSILNYRSKKIC